MKKVKIKAILFPKPYSNGENPIYIRIYYDRKSSYISIGYSVPLQAWNTDKSEVYEAVPTLNKKMKETSTKEEIKAFRKKQSSIILLPNASKINSEIKSKIGEVESLQNELSVKKELISSEVLKARIENKDTNVQYKDDFLKYVESAAKKKFDSRQIRTSDKYYSLHRILLAYRKSKVLPIQQVTTSFLTGFQQYLKKEGKHQNNIFTYLKTLRTIIQKEAIKEDKIFPPENNPFLWFTMPKVLPTVKEKLNIDEIQSIEALALDREKLIYHVRNAFLFSFYNAGIRIGDLLQLKWINIYDGRLKYFMSKTGKERNIKLLPQSKEILKIYEPLKVKDSDYIFPFLNNEAKYSELITKNDFQKASPELLATLFKQVESKATKYNSILKTIATECEIKKNLSSHIARHSFTDFAKDKISLFDLQNLLAHSTIKQTEAYINSLDEKAMDEAMNDVFSPKKIES